MTGHIKNVDVFVLCAGKQRRFGGSRSKMMFDVNGQPAIFYTLQTLLSVFQQTSITVITSYLYEELNSYISNSFPKINLVFDDCPGSGTANSFRMALGRWQSEVAFVTAGDIWYATSLVFRTLEALSLENKARVAISITPHTAVIPSHRAIISLDPFRIAATNDPNFVPQYRNVGVYAIRRNALTCFDGQISGLMEVFIAMQTAGSQLVSAIYDGAILHTGHVEDRAMWHDYFNQPPKARQ